MPDLSAIRRALEKLPATCRYHGEKIDPPEGLIRREACCDTGIPAMRRRKAEEQLCALEMEQLTRGEISINDLRRSRGITNQPSS
ncbi:hypothetical protein AAW14_06445 [Streptomyces hygroscopicus]|uniref:hypothetical protein n=1 Tax=Streptomyces hygroscopicus TaxID=1912 RepID=UPI00223F8AF3|nr:hypothetical protein [Streptomyces hygroscopicus]MCW7941678.1 hypothetical protein [Streptomyces hygroscopicus]